VFKRSTLTHIKKAVSFTLLNFGAPMAFFIVFETVGAKPAIGLAVGATILQGVAHWIFSLPISPFYIVASGFTVLFGTIDLLIDSPRFFRLEPFAQNLLIGTVFLISLKTRISVLGWLVNGLPAAFRPKIGPEMMGYLRRLTFLWGLYLLAKAFVFLYLAYHVDLGKLIILRSVIGGGSLALMIGGEIIYRKYFLSHHSSQKGHPQDAPQH
jgi:intracellular septation protein A